MTTPGDQVLSLNAFTVSFSDKTVLNGINLTVTSPGMHILMGPSGTGKSTLIRTLSGINNASPSLRLGGHAEYLGVPLGEREPPSIVVQKSRLLMSSVRENVVAELPERHTLSIAQQKEVAARLLQAGGLGELTDKLDQKVIELDLGQQRLLAIIRTVASNPRMLLVDEATSGVSDEAATRILDFLKQEAQKRAVMTIVHNQNHAKALGGQLYLMVNGIIVESNATADFFAHPQTQLGKDFVRTGSCSLPAEENQSFYINEPAEPAPPVMETVAETNRDTPDSASNDRIVKSDVYGPRNFLWLIQGALAGTPRPGIFQDLDFDLRALKRVGINVLVSLEQEADPVPQQALDKYGIRGLAFPIEDMGVPELEATERFLKHISAMVANGDAVAFHCKAGIGRTGTMLVAYLIQQGRQAVAALESARRIEPRWVQSDEQVGFLEQFEQYLAERAGTTDTPSTHQETLNI